VTDGKKRVDKDRFRPSAELRGRKDALTVTLVDPMERGHHVEYAAILATELVECGVLVNVVGSEMFVREVSSRAQVRETQVVSYKPGKGLRAELEKRRFLKDASLFALKSGSDIVHLLFLDRFLFAASRIIPRPGRIRFAATLHWAYFSRAFPQKPHFRLVRMVERHLLAEIIRLGGRVMVHSKGISELLESETGATGIDVIPYPVTGTPRGGRSRGSARQTLGLPEDAKLLLAFGATRFDKGADVAVRALAALPSNYHLLVAGQPMHFDEESLRALASEHNVQSRVHLHLGFVPSEDVELYFAASDVVLTPYRRTFAGQSGPLVLGASMGVPIVSANIMVLAETVNRYRLGALFAAERPDSLAGAVTGVLTRPFRPSTDAFLRDHSTRAFGKAVLRSYGKTFDEP
jgi:glycosyltransferase involved in cell wall biosynthesis